MKKVVLGAVLLCTLTPAPAVAQHVFTVRACWGPGWSSDWIGIMRAIAHGAPMWCHNGN